MKVKKMQQQCHLCEDATQFNAGIKGEKADITKILFVAHRPDARILEKPLPIVDSYESALFSSWTGRKITEILEHCGLFWQDVYLTNIFKCVLRGDRNPTEEEYRNCFEVFREQVQEFKPKKIVALGARVCGLMFPQESKITPPKEMCGDVLSFQGIPALVCPHPSRIWYYSLERREREFYEVVKKFLLGK